MKKLFTLFLCFNMIVLPTFAQNIIIDELVDTTLGNKNYSIKPIKINPQTDELLENITLNKALQIKQIKIENIQDELVEQNLIPQNLTGKIQKSNEILTIKDELVEQNLKNFTQKQIRKNANENYNFQLTEKITIPISITKYITSKSKSKEGEILTFKLQKNIDLENGIILKKDSLINGTLETISQNDAFGVPADIIISNFNTTVNDEKISFDGTIHQVGANRAIWVLPCSYIGILFFFAGVLFMPIRGGHAKIKPKKIYKIYYIPV